MAETALNDFNRNGVLFTSPSLPTTLFLFLAGNMFQVGALLVLILAYLAFSSDNFWFYTTLFQFYYFLPFVISPDFILSGKFKVAATLKYWGKTISEYFDMHILCDDAAQFKPEEKYIFSVGPHGIHCFTMAALANEDNLFFKRFPFLRNRVVFLAAKVLFYLPFVRDWFLLAGFRDAHRDVCKATLRQGNSLVICAGGEAESLLSKPGTDVLVYAGPRRKGIVRLALSERAPLVPVYSFYLTDSYFTFPWFAEFRKWLSKRFQICLPIFWGRGYSGMPYNVRLVTAIGAPIPLPAEIPVDAEGQVDERVVDTYQQRWIEETHALFERHKQAAGYPDHRRLEIVES